jgi:hypothetical protein
MFPIIRSRFVRNDSTEEKQGCCSRNEEEGSQTDDHDDVEAINDSLVVLGAEKRAVMRKS